MLIAIEGIDGSGKGTQALRLHEQLVRDGLRSELISFPRYSETHFGQTIGRFLNGEFGALNEVDPHLAATLYAADRFESRAMLHELLASREVVVSDRYVPSNVAHQGAKRTGEERRKLQQWIATVEYDVFQLPRADAIIHLDLPAETAQMLIARKAKRDYTDQKADLQEADRNYLAATRAAYLDAATADSNWHTIALLDGDRLRSIEEVGDEILTVVRGLLQGLPEIQASDDSVS